MSNQKPPNSTLEEWMSNATDEHLINGIEVMKTVLAARMQDKIDRQVPPQNQHPSFEKLKLILDENMQFISKHGYSLKDIHHHVFETAMNCVYGDDVWIWHNKYCKGE